MSIAQAEAAPVLDKIRTRGYWRVVIRPSSFRKNHLPNYRDLFPIIQKNSVQLRGWDYPHIDQQNPPRRGPDWVGQESEWDHKLEVWRFHQSGQFVHYFAMAGEWRDRSEMWPAEPGWEPGLDLYYVSTIYSLVEIFEFAARLALSPAGAGSMRVDIDVHRLQGRTLVSMDARIPVWGSYRADVLDWGHRWEGSQTELIALPRELAAKAAQDLFDRFGFEVGLGVLTEIQATLRR